MKWVRVLPTRLSQPLLGLAVLAQLGFSHYQLGSDGTFSGEWTVRLGHGKGRPGQALLGDGREVQSPGKPFQSPPWNPEAVITRPTCNWLLKS